MAETTDRTFWREDHSDGLPGDRLERAVGERCGSGQAPRPKVGMAPVLSFAIGILIFPIIICEGVQTVDESQIAVPTFRGNRIDVIGSEC